ncbi:extracellular calcium-sensing receptor-like [Protopterus annectens]|uniref:extracellular calcium-sensing receptor-like n=1 Tax=Protopterus annectens TaxID=7888 RepID=UPI001CF93DFC|nr:extracellular calcium-sensing receptor-like [Protopterus annectens]
MEIVTHRKKADLKSELTVLLPTELLLKKLAFNKLISPGAMHPVLSDKFLFPSFLRTLTVNKFQNTALASLVELFNWTWVGLLTEDSDSGDVSSQEILSEIENTGGCIAFEQKISVLYSEEKFIEIIDVIQSSSVNVIIINSDEVHTKVLLDYLYMQNATGKVLVLSALCIITPGLFTKETWRLLNGAIGIIPYSTKPPGFDEFLSHLKPLTSPENIFLKAFWEKAFNCKWSVNGDPDIHPTVNVKEELCTGEELIEDHITALFELNDLSYTYHTFIAVYALAHALDNLASCTPGKGPFANQSCATVHDVQPWQVLHYVRNVKFTTVTGDYIFFDEEGDAISMFHIINVQILSDENFEFVKIGQINPLAPLGEEIYINMTAFVWNDEYNQEDTSDCSNCPKDQWPSENHERCIPKSIEFLKYEEFLGALLATIAIFFCCVTVVIICIFTKYINTPVVKANNRGLSYLLLLTIMLCFICSFIFIGRPTKVTCMLRQTVFGIVFSISVSAVLAKTITVVIAFKASRPNSKLKKWMGPKIPFSFVFFCSLFQVIICFVWLLLYTPYPEYTTETDLSVMIFECNEGQDIFLYCMLGYLGILAFLTLTVSFLARALPNSFNEAKYITFSMIVFVIVWLSFIPAYLSTQGKYMVAVEIFAILSSSAGLLSCIFFTKCYIIILRPDLNTKKYLMAK